MQHHILSHLSPPLGGCQRGQPRSDWFGERSKKILKWKWGEKWRRARLLVNTSHGHSLNGCAFFSCCSMLGGFLQFYSGFDSVRESLCTKHRREDSPPPPQHLHRKRNRVISRILLTLHINNLIASWSTVPYYCSSATSEHTKHMLSSFLIQTTQVVPSSIYFSVFLHTCKHKLGHTHAGTHTLLAKLLLTVRKEVWVNISWPSTEKVGFPSQHSLMLDMQTECGPKARGQRGCWLSFCWTLQSALLCVIGT